MKLESVEARALVALMNSWDPHVIVDLHTTDGSYHGYHLTYAPALTANADDRLVAFTRETLLANVRKALLDSHGLRSYYYGNFASEQSGSRERPRVDPDNPGDTVWRTFDHRPRFGNNYAGLRNRITILSEAYSYLDFRGRVAVSEAFVEEICRYTASHGREVTALIARLDRDAAAGKPMEGGVEFELKALPEPVEILVGEVKRIKNPRSGKEMVAMVEEKVTPTRMTDYGLFNATRRLALPKGYIFRNEEGLQTILAKLQAQGFAIEKLKRAQTFEVESFQIERVNKAPRAFQGHQEIRLKGRMQTEQIKFPAGSILVRTNNSRRALAFYLLEAESDDGFVNWNFLDQYLEKGKTYPIYRVIGER
jgi:hypothetical protein